MAIRIELRQRIADVVPDLRKRRCELPQGARGNQGTRLNHEYAVPAAGWYGPLRPLRVNMACPICRRDRAVMAEARIRGYRWSHAHRKFHGTSIVVIELRRNA
jgi:hypothetical protein